MPRGPATGISTDQPSRFHKLAGSRGVILPLRAVSTTSFAPVRPCPSTLSQIAGEWKITNAGERPARDHAAGTRLPPPCATINTPHANWKIANRAPGRPGRVRDELHGRSLG